MLITLVILIPIPAIPSPLPPPDPLPCSFIPPDLPHNVHRLKALPVNIDFAKCFDCLLLTPYDFLLNSYDFLLTTYREQSPKTTPRPPKTTPRATQESPKSGSKPIKKRYPKRNSQSTQNASNMHGNLHTHAL